MARLHIDLSASETAAKILFRNSVLRCKLVQWRQQKANFYQFKT